jgi:hypothetical protein
MIMSDIYSCVCTGALARLSAAASKLPVTRGMIDVTRFEVESWLFLTGWIVLLY